MWMLVTGRIERILKVASLAMMKFVHRSWSIFNLFVLDTDRILWLLLSYGVVYVCMLLLNANSATDWAWRDGTGRYRTRSDRSGHNRPGQNTTRQNTARRDRLDRTQREQNSTLWLLIIFGVVYVCLLLLNANYATEWAWRDRTVQDRTQLDWTGHNRTGQDTMVQDTTGPDSMVHNGERNGTGWNGTGQERIGQGCSWWFEFNSSVGYSIVLCIYVKLYYLLVTDLSEK